MAANDPYLHSGLNPASDVSLYPSTPVGGGTVYNQSVAVTATANVAAVGQIAAARAVAVTATANVAAVGSRDAHGSASGTTVSTGSDTGTQGTPPPPPPPAPMVVVGGGYTTQRRPVAVPTAPRQKIYRPRVITVPAAQPTGSSLGVTGSFGAVIGTAVRTGRPVTEPNVNSGGVTGTSVVLGGALGSTASYALVVGMLGKRRVTAEMTRAEEDLLILAGAF